MTTRRNVLSTIGVGILGLFGGDVLMGALSKKRKWNAVMFVGFDDSNTPTIILKNVTDYESRLHIHGVYFGRDVSTPFKESAILPPHSSIGDTAEIDQHAPRLW